MYKHLLKEAVRIFSEHNKVCKMRHTPENFKKIKLFIYLKF